MNYLDIDFETRSEAAIDVGAAKYSEHPSTEILMISFYSHELGRIINANPYTKKLALVNLKKAFEKVARNPKTWRVRAQNAEFEYWNYINVGVRQFGWPPLTMDSFFCTMSLSGSNSYPAALEKAGQAMDLPTKKNTSGKELIGFFCKPSRKKNEIFKEPLDYPEKFQKFVEYCNDDVAVQMGIVDFCEPLNKMQTKILHMTERMNAHGLPIDTRMCKGAVKLMAMYQVTASARLKEITKGAIESGTQATALTKFLNKTYKAKVPDMTAPTVAAKLLDDDLHPVVRECLEIRQNTSLNSLAKYATALVGHTKSKTIHDFIKAYVTITGRWAGRGLQIQNFSKPCPKQFPGWDGYDIEYLCKLIARADREAIEQSYGPIMEVLKGATRAMIKAPKGYKFVCADYAQVEARIVMWNANDPNGLDDFAGDGKIYEKMAGSIFEVPWQQIKKGSFERDVGKAAVLGCGFGMGWARFQSQALQNGFKIPDQLAKRCVKVFRERYGKVKKAWYDCEDAAKLAIQHKGKKFYACNNKLCYQYVGKALRVTLPSGRFIFYPEACIRTVQKWGHPSQQISYRAWVDARKVGENWCWKEIWGSTLFQMTVQAMAGDIMAHGLLNAEEAGYFNLFTVHDEGVALVKAAFGSYQEYEKLLEDTPKWAKTIPIIAEGWQGLRYRK